VNGQDFIDSVDAHPKFEFRGFNHGKTAENPLVVVYTAALDTLFGTPLITIQKTSWDQIEDMLLGKRAPDIMIQITRVVGYYSRVQNWNRSKLAELKDRQAGAKCNGYAVPGKIREMDAELPEEITAILAKAGGEMICDLSKKKVS